MPSLTFAALVSSGRFALEAAFVAGALVFAALLLVPDPTSTATLPAIPLALVVGVAVAWRQYDG